MRPAQWRGQEIEGLGCGLGAEDSRELMQTDERKSRGRLLTCTGQLSRTTLRNGKVTEVAAGHGPLQE